MVMQSIGARALVLSAIVACTVSGALSKTVLAQSSYDLNAPGLNRSSRAIQSDRELRIFDQTGSETLYIRHPQADSNDGRFIAYRNNGLNQIVRWPLSGTGPMEIGTVIGNSVEYRTSQMQVSPRGGNGNAIPPGGLVLPPGAETKRIIPGSVAPQVNPRGDLFGRVWQQQQVQPQVMRLATRDDRGRDWLLGYAGSNRLAMFATADPTISDWYVVPAGRSYVRVQQLIGNHWMALAVGPRKSLLVELVSQDPRQLWRVVQPNYAGGGYWLESAVASGFALSGAPTGTVALLPINGSASQLWWPVPAPVLPNYEPLWRSVNHEIRPNPPLNPAQIDVVNSHSGALILLIGDLRSGRARQMRIDPKSQATVAFDRDSGATVVESYEIRGTSGLWDQQQFVTAIPPAPLYDVSVYEEFLQSIAIDRTGTSPNPIEDLNYQPKSVGWLEIPAGSALPDRGQFDAYAEAKAANNPGAVRRFDPKSLERPGNAPDPLESILKSLAPDRSKRQKF